jgi:hypothetical protein
MRILSARATEIRVERVYRRVDAVIVLRLDLGDGESRDLRVPTSAPITSSGGAPLKERLIASAKLILAMSHPSAPVEEAEVIRPAA